MPILVLFNVKLYVAVLLPRVAMERRGLAQQWYILQAT